MTDLITFRISRLYGQVYMLCYRVTLKKMESDFFLLWQDETTWYGDTPCHFSEFNSDANTPR